MMDNTENSHSCRQGKCILYIGPMFASKTTTMIACARRHQYLVNNTEDEEPSMMFIKPVIDTRNGDNKSNITTHDGIKMIATPCNELMSLINFNSDFLNSDFLNSQIIGIDEGQFFPDIYEFTVLAVEKYGKIVIIAALDNNFRREPYERIIKLVPFADKSKKLTAICMECKHEEAIFTKRRTDNQQAILIGGKKIYKAVCRSCYLKK